MPRYIDADDAIYELERAFPVDDYGKIIRCISRIPTADVVERKKGKWIKSNESALRPYMCSECGALFDVDTVLGKLSWQYCPNCGADMKGEDDE